MRKSGESIEKIKLVIRLKTFNCECLLGNQITPSHPLAREKLRKNVWLRAVAVRSVPQKCLRHRLCLCRFFFGSQVKGNVVAKHAPPFKVTRYSFSGSIPFKFEHKLLRHKQRFGKIDITVALDKDENLSWSRLQWHQSCHSNEMTPLPILLEVVFLGQLFFQNRWRELFPPIVASMFVKFKLDL